LVGKTSLHIIRRPKLLQQLKKTTNKIAQFSALQFFAVKVSRQFMPNLRSTQPGHPSVGRRNEYQPNAVMLCG